MMPLVSVIIPTKNGKKRILDCINSVLNQTYKNYEIIVVDDGSEDGTPRFILNNFRGIKVIVARQGLAENRNIGVYNSSGNYIVMLDDDARLNNEWIMGVVHFMDKEKNAALVGGKILLDNGKIFSVGGRISRLGNAYDIGYGEPSDSFQEVRKRMYVNTTALIARKEMIEKVGIFDKAHFFGFEDADLGWKCNIAGFDVFYNPNVIAYHPPKNLKIRKDPFWRTYVWRKTKTMTYLKNYELFTLISLSPFLLGVFFYNLLFKSDRVETLKGYLWSLINLNHILCQRRKIKKFRHRNDRELLKMFKWSFK